ncbi:MAG: AbrB/MazE/SpoVT family DNA-binding domain-containing protein [Thermofilum sp.]|jgi:AbrB family looped-hinge helix DNA binding protein|nr:AbrB/MazE/SpoVT family DNA-binding domain-containing protein [Thermofilum sp.]
MEKAIIKVHKRGIIVIPKRIREMLSIDEGTLLELRIENGKILLEPLDLWGRMWKCCQGSAEEAEEELSREEENFWAKRE